MTEEKPEEAAEQPRRRHPRRPDLSQTRILEAATAEFAANGLAGARIDAIADRAEINKRMIYQYFGSKEMLYQAVLEKVYRDVWDAEAALHLDALPPREALVALITFVWTYYLEHPEFITILNSENQLKAAYFRKSRILRDGAATSQPLVDDILRRGELEGIFRAGIDPVQLSLTITSICYYYFTNQATSSLVYGQRMMTRAALEKRLSFNVETILALVAPPAPSAA
ncbi:TetR/AcrR family transcriptional regulator [Rhizobium sp. Leaf341]|uniref:TetR/AcrR family transcriptional regulator n=1 Tax=Rhizobium sp. Leaf341 TaxID=1736344 RepID=UPI0007150AC6|nr:TetR/AcrR family transcriptional regulator [Rhizobium sp. Leaf341]KQR72984.1 TetR family transcriptional regulator [Rhizobium sp. Leaf341]